MLDRLSGFGAREVIAVKGETSARVTLFCAGTDVTTHTKIPDAIRKRIRKLRERFEQLIVVAYGDCGTGEMLDAMLDEEA